MADPTIPAPGEGREPLHVADDRPWLPDVSPVRVLDAIGEAVIVSDPADVIVFWNTEATRLFGWSADEALGRRVADLLTVDSRTDRTTGPARAGATSSDPTPVTDGPSNRGGPAHERWTGEIRTRRRDGSSLTALVTRSAVHRDDGTPTALISVVRDITASRADASGLATSRREFRALIDVSGDLFVVTDRDAVIRSLVGPSQAHFGIAAEALVGTSMFDLVLPADRHRVRDQWARQLATPEAAATDTDDYWTLRADGTWLCLELLVTNLLDDPAVAGLAVVGRDITDRRNLERARVAISGANSALVHATSEDDLFDEICNVVVNETRYHLAWIGLSDTSRPLGVRMVAYADHSAAYFDALEHLAGADAYEGPIVQAMASGHLAIVQDIAAMPEALPWRRLALDFGYRSMIALPLRFSADDHGVLAIYSEEPNVFTDDTVLVLTELSSDLAFGVEALRTRAQRSVYRGRFEASLEAAVRAIATAAELRDPYTAGHQRRVAELAIAIATELGLDDDAVMGIGTAASIHDIGKLTVPAEILSRPGRLTTTEFALIQEHAQAGHDIVAGIDFPWPVATMILQHHERLDGSGYPQHLQVDEILVGARIIAVADTVEAMQAHRPYRPGLGIEVALQTIADERGTLFDPAVVDACIRLFHEQGFAFSA